MPLRGWAKPVEEERGKIADESDGVMDTMARFGHDLTLSSKEIKLISKVANFLQTEMSATDAESGGRRRRGKEGTNGQLLTLPWHPISPCVLVFRALCYRAQAWRRLLGTARSTEKHKKRASEQEK